AVVRAAAAARDRLRGAARSRPPAAPVRRSRDLRRRPQARRAAPRGRRTAMTLFVVLGVALVAGALLFLVPPLARRTARQTASRDAVNAAVYRDQLRELEADLRAGTLAPDQHDKARSEIEARLAADLGKGEAAPQTPGSSRGAALALGLALPVCALAVYLSVGNPRALSPQ